MSRVQPPVLPLPAAALCAASRAAQRTRRDRSAGGRSGEQSWQRIDAVALPRIEETACEASGLLLSPLDRMIGIFGHDLKGLLNALTVNAELLLRRNGDTRVDSARNVRRTIHRMDQLVTSLLDYVRLKADTLEIVSRPFDAAELLREAVDIFGPLARARSLSLVLAVPAGPLLATADPDRLFQVISNILANAIKFSSPEGGITVRAAKLGDDLQVDIEDDGSGIPERDLDRVFEGFCQLREADARGLGLGLYIARAIVQAHDGRIWATSRPGAGSTFHFVVPGKPSPQPSARPPGSVPRAARA